MQDSWGHTEGTSSDSFWGPKGVRRQPWACKSPSSPRTWHEWQYLEMATFPDPQPGGKQGQETLSGQENRKETSDEKPNQPKKKVAGDQTVFRCFARTPDQEDSFSPPERPLPPPNPQLCLDGGWPRAGADTDTRVTFPAPRPSRCFKPLRPNERRWKSQG